MTFTFAKGRRAVPLRGVAGNTADNDLADKFVALITEETQSLSCLVAVLVQGLVTVVRDSGVWTWVIFYCGDMSALAVKFFKCAVTRMFECREVTHRHTSGCGRSTWACRCLVRGRRFGWDLPAGNPGYKRNGPLFPLRNLLRGAQSALRSPPLLDRDTAGL